MMDRKRHWEKLGAEEEWSEKARGERDMTIYIPDIWMILGKLEE